MLKEAFEIIIEVIKLVKIILRERERKLKAVSIVTRILMLY